MTIFSDVFPPVENDFVEKEDSKYFSIDLEDNTIRAPSEGGYEFTRKRFTRTPRKTFATGFTMMSQTDLNTIIEFWDEYQGAKPFAWLDPTTNNVYTVRFADKPSIVYNGIGNNFMYDVTVKLKQL
jgi:phage-related protein